MLIYYIINRQLNSSFQPQRSGEPESGKVMQLLDLRLRENDGMMNIRQLKYSIYR